LNTTQIENAAKLDGKYLLYSTDQSLPASDIVKAYFEKDFIEKVFRTLKSKEDLGVIRHHLENRVRAIIFVCVLAYRLLAVLKWKLLSAHKEMEDTVWDSTNSFLNQLSRIEQMEVSQNNIKQTWFLNLTQNIQDTLKRIGYKNMFIDKEM
jgi:transposase